jgi:hypothetical protein
MGAYFTTAASYEATLLDIQAPTFVREKEVSQIFIITQTLLSLATSYKLLQIFPDGSHKDITAAISQISVPGIIYLMYRARVVFDVPGLHTFLLQVYDSSAYRTSVSSTQCSAWAANIDVPTSQLGKQRSDIQRVFSRVNNGGKN